MNGNRNVSIFITFLLGDDMNELKLLTAKDVAKVLQISVALSYRLVTEGQLPSVRFGRTVRVRPEDLENFIQNNLTNPLFVSDISNRKNVLNGTIRGLS